jgi:hypothetical protein
MLRRIVPFIAVVSVVLPLACISADPGLPPSAPLTCDEYCRAVQGSCTGVNAQYRNAEECKKVCALLDLGTRDDGNTPTVGCRFNKAKTAKTKSECAAAGPYGGGVCGNDRCEAYCTIVEKECILAPDVPAALHPFATRGDCDEACPNFALSAVDDDGPPNSNDGGDTLNCRMRHLIIAIDAPDPHCSHAGVQSAACKP